MEDISIFGCCVSHDIGKAYSHVRSAGLISWISAVGERISEKERKK